MHNASDCRSCTCIERMERFRYSILAWISHHQSIGRICDRMSATETVGQRVGRCRRIALRKVLDARRRSVPEGIDALVIIASNKSDNPSSNEFVDELLVYRIQILVFV